MTHATQRSSAISRRALLTGAAAVVIGFDPVRRAWVTAEAAGPFHSLPPLDGVLLTDDAALGHAADDFGHIVHHRPAAVLRPGSVRDVAVIVRFARRHGLKVAARGRGHSVLGQTQVSKGVQIDMSTLSAIGEVGPDRVSVGAGATWDAVVRATVPHGLTPPVLTSTLLSVGGTLSMGGIGTTSFRFGAQVDNVLELDVVTGNGHLVTCSSVRRRELFEMMLVGQGQCGLIVRATVRLVPAATRARVFDLPYPDLPSATRDLRLLMDDGRFDSLLVVPLPGQTFLLQAAAFFSPPDQPDDARLLAGLPSPRTTEESYLDFVSRNKRLFDQLEAAGVLGLPHPWLALRIPDSSVDQFVAEALATVRPEEIDRQRGGFLLLHGHRSQPFTRPLFRVPAEPVFFTLGLFTAGREDPADVDRQVRRNRRLFERNREQGGVVDAFSAVPMSHADWLEHFGSQAGRLVAAKLRYDPQGVLTPGPGIFQQRPHEPSRSAA